MAWSEAARAAAARARELAAARTYVRGGLRSARNAGRNAAVSPRTAIQYRSMSEASHRKLLAKSLKEHRANLKSISTGPINGREADYVAYNAGFSTQIRNSIRRRQKGK